MARPWRIEFEGALYHVLSRGNEHKDIFRDNKDRVSFLNCLGEMSARFETDIFAYVLMGNHYHILFGPTKPICPEPCNGWEQPIRCDSTIDIFDQAICFRVDLKTSLFRMTPILCSFRVIFIEIHYGPG